jgi:thiol-disulfide isomerase/thioredoxin
MKRLIAFIFCLQLLTAFSLTTSITGTAIGHPDELVRVIVYSDQFSRLDSTLVTVNTDVWGNFALQVPIAEPTYAFLALGPKRGGLHIVPGKSYQVQVIEDTIKGSIFDQLPLQFNLYAEKDSLNPLIGRFNYKYNVFLYEKQRDIIRSKNSKVVNDFISLMRKEFISARNEQNIYLENYVDYTLAALEWLSGSKSDSTILMDYFIRKKVLRENIAYTDFFKDFFREYFKTQKYYGYNELVSSINSGTVLHVDSLLQRNELLALNDELRELSLMLLVAGNYHNRDISDQSVYKLFRQIELSSNYEQNRAVARNYLKKLAHLQYGSKAPAIELINQFGDIFELSDFKGSFVLLDFITSSCGPCYFEMEKLRDIQQKLANKLEIILVVSDGDINSVINQMGEYNNSFLLLDLNNNILMLESYEIKTFPSYVLINPDGTIAMAPAPPPNENLGHFIEGFIARYKNK